MDETVTDQLPNRNSLTRWQVVVEVFLLVTLFFIYAGDMPPMVNEAHYLVKAKNFWQPDWCANDLFAASSKAHTTFYVLFGWLTQFTSFEVTAWVGRFTGWAMLALGLQQLTWNMVGRRYASLGVAAIWIAGIQYGNLAGEWVIGGIEAKVPAYGLILLALSNLIQRHWNRVWIYLGAASAFHVLSGGWSVIAAAIAWWFTERRQPDSKHFFTPSLFIGGAVALLGLVPAVWLTLGASSEDSAFAARIYSYYRIKHHLLPADFQLSWFIRHGVLIAWTAVVSVAFWKNDGLARRMGWFTVGAVAIAAAGLIVGTLPALMPDLAAKLLRYYWFRLADAVVPLMFALMSIKLLESHGKPNQRIAGIAILVAAIVLVGDTAYRRSTLGVPPSCSNDLLGLEIGASPKQQQKVFRDWRSVCRWARLSTPNDEVFLTPRHQQTFKWYAERAEVVNWKDVPQDASSLKEWNRRFQEIFPRRLGHIRVTIQYKDLRQYRKRYGVRYLIVDRRVVGENLPMIKIYPTEYDANDTYAVYELPTVLPEAEE